MCKLLELEYSNKEHLASDLSGSIANMLDEEIGFGTNEYEHYRRRIHDIIMDEFPDYYLKSENPDEDLEIPPEAPVIELESFEV